MKKAFIKGMFVLTFICMVCGPAFGADIELAKKSTIEKILKSGELRVGFESGYLPFEMTNKKGDFMGFDIDMAKELAMVEQLNGLWLVQVSKGVGFTVIGKRQTAASGRFSRKPVIYSSCPVS